MEAEGCTVDVSGLPGDIEEDRLADKLYIHFLRGRHGGGEITSVNITKTTPGSALITFEDSNVAQSVVQYGTHILLVDDKEYRLTVSFPSKEVDQDKVFTCMRVTVDYKWLPLGKEAISSLQCSFPEVQCGFDLPVGLCTLSGRYSVLQAMVTQLLSLLEKPASLGTWGSTARESPTSGVMRDPSRGSADRPNSDGERQSEATALLGQASGPDLGGLGQVSPGIRPSDQTLEGSSGANRRRGAQEDPPPEDYDHSLIVDIDTFRYLQKHCGEEYERILNRHGVEAVEVTTGGVTTLLLLAKPGEVEGVGGGSLWQAHRDLSDLCQETESRLCREQLPKESGPQEGLQQALEILQLQLPQLLLGQDSTHVSIVGSSGDVLEAKLFLLDLRADEVVGHRPRLGRTGLDPASNASRLDASAGKTLRTCRSGSPEGRREYRLAARFRDTKSRDHGLGTGLGNTLLTPSNAFKEHSFARKHKSGIDPILGSGPILSSGQISDKGRLGVGVGGLNLEDQKRFDPTGQDVPLEKFDPLSAASEESRPFLSSTPIGSGPPNEKLQVGSSQSTVQHMDLFRDRRVQTAAVPHSESSFRTTLRRANSFSGYSRNKQDQKVGDAGGFGGKLSRGNVSTPGIRREGKEVYSVEVQAPAVMWEYMKDAYRTRLEDIISGSQMKESQSESGVTTVILRGAEPSKVDGCQRELKNMINMVATDFFVQELLLASLGVADPRDETLDMCCTEVRRKFRKVKIQQRKESLVFIGPKQLCTQVVGALVEVFHGGAERRKEQRESPPGVGETSDTSLTSRTQNQTFPPQSDSQDRSSSLVPPDGSRKEPVTQRGDETGPSSSEHKQNVQKLSGGRGQQVSQSAAQKEPVTVEKLGKGRPKDGKHGGTNATLFTHPTSASTRKASVITGTGPLSQSAPGKTAQNRTASKKDRNPKPKSTNTLTQMETLGSPVGSESPGSTGGEEPARQTSSMSEHAQEENQNQGQTCVCGERGSSVTRTPCGVALCSQCLSAHAQCRVCPRVEEAWGIQGTMTFTELPQSLAGHSKDLTLKITYSIPDGIQGEGHPAPGAPFRGGVFQAYLPVNLQTRGLLPQLTRAFTEGRTFTVRAGDGGARVAWGRVPHKTRTDGGKSENGYPDSGYISLLTEELRILGAEESTALAKTHNKTNN
ncbi:hypothetical protein SKAU_G00289730 [Synaphobranchus kaupii]|uniref:RING-type E3 ubiquitin transferase n=1 Tax=Synaphobranchus kaupii TaxID=118154 RepID=A0A9Q1ETK0_SYNKA|nr:hypothetical protein SKAU_G00289730 [Synaphobranchus kaupii]